MGNVIKANTVQVVTKDGEIRVTLDLNININSGVVEPINVTKAEPAFEIPMFSASPKVKFGKKAD